MDHPYTARPLDAQAADDLDRSVARRRLLGWQIVQQLFTPVAVPAGPMRQGESDMALWQTWFTSDEIVKMFEILYRALPHADRVADPDDAGPVADTLVDCALRRYASEARLRRRHGAMFDQRILRRIAQLKDRPARSLAGVAKGVTLFNLAVARHYLANYAAVVRCTRALAERYDGDLGTNFAPCFFKEFPPDAVAVKVVWVRADEEIELFDTSAGGIEAALGGDKTWRAACDAPPCRVAAGGAELDRQMFSTRVQHPDRSENSFRLTAMHVATKETRDWTWTTLWWSHKPDEDFGEDRPEWLGVYGDRRLPELRSYKMCNATGYREKDAALLARLGAFRVRPDDKSLAGAMLAAYASGTMRAPGSDPDTVLTWCSNPYVERDPGMADTNCIGCHQHAGPDSEMANIRYQENHVFPADYAWSLEFFLDLIGKENDNFKSKFEAVAQRDRVLPQDVCTDP